VPVGGDCIGDCNGIWQTAVQDLRSHFQLPGDCHYHALTHQDEVCKNHVGFGAASAGSPAARQGRKAACQTDQSSTEGSAICLEGGEVRTQAGGGERVGIASARAADTREGGSNSPQAARGCQARRTDTQAAQSCQAGSTTSAQATQAGKARCAAISDCGVRAAGGVG
jgi:hypothetical protein